MLYIVQSDLQYLLQDIETEQPGPGDDAALARLVSSEDEVGRSQQLRLSQANFGFLVAGETEFKTHCWDTERTLSPHTAKQCSGTNCFNSVVSQKLKHFLSLKFNCYLPLFYFQILFVSFSIALSFVLLYLVSVLFNVKHLNSLVAGLCDTD